MKDDKNPPPPHDWASTINFLITATITVVWPEVGLCVVGALLLLSSLFAICVMVWMVGLMGYTFYTNVIDEWISKLHS